MSYEKQINKSKNKIKTTWNVINNELHKQVRKENTQILNSEGKNDMNLNIIAEDFNKYFSGVADTIHKQIKKNCINPNPKTKSNNYMTYMSMAFESPFPNIQIKKTTYNEIEKVIGSLKASQAQGYDEISNNILKACKTFY